ncbi:MAG: ABC transporter ATP-binding protein [Phycisphaerae bacterium]|nr:ABC transporter ATP-binding protein [Phycisphaerae bacterium]
MANHDAITSSPKPSEPLMSVEDLAVSFDNGSGPRIQAVAGVSMSVYPRQTLAVVGESGCGKSVTAMSSMQLIPRPPGRFDAGRIMFEGRNLLELPERDMLKVRGGKIAMIFQEPMTSLNPVYTIGDQIMEAVLLHQAVSPDQAAGIAIQAMADVGIRDPEGRMRAYPHQFSGGMRQRVMIAMALACRPSLLLADEPTTALDVTIQKQILELLRGLQQSSDMGMMLITHNLGVVAENADVVCCMYAGRVVEYAPVTELFDRPLHPYTRGLFRCIPGLSELRNRLVTVEEVVADPREYEGLRGEAGPVVPWWPFMDESQRPKLDDPNKPYALVEVSPNRWVGCWRTPDVARHPSRPPRIAPA